MRAFTLFFLFLPIFCTQVQAGDTIYNVVTVNGKKGLKDEQGNFVISPKYDDIGWSDGSETPADGVVGYQRSGDWGLISLNDQEITTAKYDHLLPYRNEAIIASIKGKFSQRSFYGIINTKGKSIFEFKYYALKPANDYLIALSKIDHQLVYGLIDASEQTILDFKYKTIELVSDHLVKAEQTYNKIHLFNTDTGQRLGEEFTSISKYNEQYSLLQTGFLVGLLDHNGRIVVSPKYEIIKKENRGNWIGKELTEWDVLDDSNTIINEINCRELTFVKGLLKTSTSEGERFLNRQFNNVTHELFDEVIDVTGSKVLFRNNYEYGVYDLNTETYLKNAKFDTAYVSGEFIYGAKTLHNKLKWALYDTFGVKRTYFDYDVIRSRQDRLFAVNRRGHWGFIDRVGKEVIHCVYDQVAEFVDGLVVVKYHGQYGVIDKKNEWVVLPQASEIEIVNDQLYLSKEEQTTKLMSVAGELIYFTDNEITLENNALREELSNGRQQMISLEGVYVGNNSARINTYEHIKYLADEFMAVKINGKYGFVDKNHQLRITNRYEDVGHYSSYGIPVMLLGKWGVINEQEAIVVQPIYDAISLPTNGVRIITAQNKKGLMTASGEVLIEPRFTDIEVLKNGEYLVNIDGKYGLIGQNGKQLINAKYDQLERLDSDLVIVKKRNSYGTITLNGVEAIPSLYDQIYYHKEWKLYFAKREGEWKSILIP